MPRCGACWSVSKRAFKARKVKVSIGCKQLYHDREEVTCHLRRLDIKPR